VEHNWAGVQKDLGVFISEFRSGPLGRLFLPFKKKAH
jgi:hypothetical protein